MPDASIHRLHHTPDSSQHGTGEVRQTVPAGPQSSRMATQHALSALSNGPVVTNRLSRTNLRAPLPQRPSDSPAFGATVQPMAHGAILSRSPSVSSIDSFASSRRPLLRTPSVSSIDSFASSRRPLSRSSSVSSFDSRASSRRASLDSERPLIDLDEPEDFYRSATLPRSPSPSPSPNHERTALSDEPMRSASREGPVERDAPPPAQANVPPASTPPANMHAPVAGSHPFAPHPNAVPYAHNSGGAWPGTMNPMNAMNAMNPLNPMNAMSGYGYGPMGRLQQLFGIGTGIFEAVLMILSAFVQLIKSWAAKVEQAAAPVR